MVLFVNLILVGKMRRLTVGNVWQSRHFMGQMMVFAMIKSTGILKSKI